MSIHLLIDQGKSRSPFTSIEYEKDKGRERIISISDRTIIRRSDNGTKDSG